MGLRSLFQRVTPRTSLSGNGVASAPQQVKMPTQGSDERVIAQPAPDAGCLDVTRKLCCRTVHYSPRLHAAQLLVYREQKGWVGYAVTSGDLQDAHGSMCAEAGWWIRPWNPVGRQVALLTTQGKKVYEWQTDRGVRKRLRVFPIPSAAIIRTVCDPILGRCSLAVPKAYRDYPWPGAPSTPDCLYLGRRCPIWRAPGA
jgi:hypothetical protein